MKIRNCAWLGDSGQDDTRTVWARGQIASTQCPKSVISAESLRYLDLYRSWRSLGKGLDLQYDAKIADALELLENESMKEEEHGKEE